jgi:hypothetical protein
MNCDDRQHYFSLKDMEDGRSTTIDRHYIHRLHFKESILNNPCRSNHGDLQSIHLLDVCVYHLHPDAVNREGRRSIIDWDDRRRTLAVIIF